jgi:hypothetical protein
LLVASYTVAVVIIEIAMFAVSIRKKFVRSKDAFSREDFWTNTFGEASMKMSVEV